ncbi:Ein3-binding F box protein 1 [Elysia marginata]|uniref:Ein3-binding F box protein 1 n=1 Tax=Elysia marginata TaxID=1093978 RepID=A0AAV4GXM9_9GAST|nr:Ein3-binding F box protein 1 [Elysia marginata]
MRNLLSSIQNSLQSLTFGTACRDGGIFELFGSSYKYTDKRRFPALRRLDYSYSSVAPRNLTVARFAHHEIEELYLCHTRISFSEAMVEAGRLRNLRVLVYSDSSVCLNHDMPRAKIKAMRVPKVCTKLEVVALLTTQVDLDDEVIQEFTRHCPKLKSLSLTCSSSLSADAFTFINTSTSCITNLELKDRRGTEPYLHFVLLYFPHLTHLAVNGQYVHLQDSTAIAHCCPNLQELLFKIDGSGNGVPEENNVDHEHLMNILLKCRKLQEVYFDRKKEAKLAGGPPQRFSPGSTSSESMKDADDNPFIDMTTSDEDNVLEQMLPQDTSLSPDLDLEPTSSLAVSKCPSLETDFCTPTSLNDDPTPRIFHNHCPIKRLSLAQSLVQEKFLMAMIWECPLLTLLDLNGAEALTDDLVVSIARNCSNLDTLGLSLGVDLCSDLKFGDRGLKALIKHCRKLECLSILNNRNVTSEAVQALLQALETTLPRLKTVSLCVGRGFSCSPSVISVYGLKYLTEFSKKQLNRSSPNNKSSFLIHLDFKRR